MANSTYTEVKTPLTNMSFTPDIPPSALSANEYNSGFNVETDTRGLRSVFGDIDILQTIPGVCSFVSAGYRANGVWWFIVCSLTVVSGVTQARWYMLDSATSSPVNITPGYGANTNAFLTGYTYDTPITDTWNGTVLFINDSVNAPMYLLESSVEFVPYSQNSNTYVTTAASGTGTTATLTFATQATAPFAVGSQIVVSAIAPIGYQGTYTVTACTTSTVSYLNTTTGSQTAAGNIVQNYQWNYTPGWSSVSAGFMRMYATPNVGSILIAGNLTAKLTNNTVKNYPATVQWSQSFGLNSGPTTWAPTATNIANQLEIPVRGPIVDGFPANGNFYVCSYWDTCVFSPIAYQGTNYPVLGVKLLNQGRGLLNENCWANADQTIYGLDARDLWVFDGNNFKSLGNQRVKDWFFANLNPTWADRTFVVNNTSKNQIEYYFPDLNSTGGCNQMLAYRYDLDVFQAPRTIDVPNGAGASHAVESPRLVSGTFNPASRSVVYSRFDASSKLIQKDTGTTWHDGSAITSTFQRDNIALGLNYSQQALMHRVLPEIYNIDTNGLPINGVGNITIALGGSDAVGVTSTFTPATTLSISSTNPWIQANQNAYRVYALKLNNTSSTDTWQATAVSWQFIPTEDDR
jgi:hypothetical protein